MPGLVEAHYLANLCPYCPPLACQLAVDAVPRKQWFPQLIYETDETLPPLCGYHHEFSVSSRQCDKGLCTQEQP